MNRTAWLLLAGWGLLALLGVFIQRWAVDHYGLVYPIPESAAVHALVGLAFVGAGLVARRSRSESRIGGLLILIGLLWTLVPVLTAPLFDWANIPRVAALAVFPIILITFPSGRLVGWERWAAGVWVAVVVGEAIFGVLFEDNALRFRFIEVPSHLLLISHQPEITGPVTRGVFVFVAVMMSAATVIAVRRWAASTPALRSRIRPLGLILAPVILITVAVPALRELSLLSLDLGRRGGFYLEATAMLLLPLAIASELLHTSLARARVGDMVRSLEGAVDSENVEVVLRLALGDSNARLVFRRPGSDEYVDRFGSTAASAVDGEAVTDLAESAVLIHDREIDPELVRSVAAAASMALANGALQAELRAQMEELRRSRQRIVAAADDARRRVERDLHDGAQQRLVSLAVALEEAQRAGVSGERLDELLQQASHEAVAAITDLRDLARGVHPAILSQAGLQPAVASLVDHSPIPVEVDIGPERYSQAVEVAVYFVVAEGLANAIKHSEATRVVVEVKARPDELSVAVTDNGSGGANAAGSGMRGLRDRVEALGGRLEISSGRKGTHVNAWIPLQEAGD